MRSSTARSGCDFTASGFQELLNRGANRGGESVHVVDRNITLAALDRADVSPVQTRFFSEVFLRDSQSLAMPAQVVPRNLAEVSLTGHESMLDNVMPLRLQT